METVIKLLLEREFELEHKRVVALSRQMWAKAMDAEARLDELKLWKNKLSERLTLDKEAERVKAN